MIPLIFNFIHVGRGYQIDLFLVFRRYLFVLRVVASLVYNFKRMAYSLKFN